MKNQGKGFSPLEPYGTKDGCWNWWSRATQLGVWFSTARPSFLCLGSWLSITLIHRTRFSVPGPCAGGAIPLSPAEEGVHHLRGGCPTLSPPAEGGDGPAVLLRCVEPTLGRGWLSLLGLRDQVSRPSGAPRSDLFLSPCLLALRAPAATSQAAWGKG